MASLYKEKSYQFSADDGTPLSGGKVYFYVTSTSTPKDTYSDEALTTPNANPVILDADGRSANQIWISGRYRVVLKDSADVTISDDDPVEDSVAGSTPQGAQSWGGNNSGTADALVFTYDPPITSYTAGVTLRGRITADNTAGVTVNAGAGVKSLVKQDGTALIAGDLQGPGIITFSYDSTLDAFRLQSADGHLFRDGINAPARVDVASASTVNLQTAASNYVRITGTTTITGITLNDGVSRDVVFGGALTLTNGASLILPGGANITTAAGDTCRIIGEASSVVRVVNYRVASLPVNNVPFEVLNAAGAGTNINTTASETSAYTYTVAANKIATGGTLRLSLIGLYLNNTGANRDIDIRVEFGSTTIYDGTFSTIATAATGRGVLLDVTMMAIGASTQRAFGVAYLTDATLPDTATTGVLGDRGVSAAYDSSEALSSSKALTVYIQHSFSSGSLQFQTRAARVTLEST